jgi:hypothetical protein
MKLNRKIYETQREKRNDFIGGFFGWFIVNVVAYTVVSLAAGAAAYLLDRISGGEPFIPVFGYAALLLPLIFNIGLLIYLALTRKWMAFGALAAFATLLTLVVLLGVFIVAACSGTW